MRRRTVDIALERRDGVGLHPLRRVVGDDEALGFGIHRPGVERAQPPPHAPATARDLVQIVERHEIAGAQVDRGVGPAVAADHAASRNSRLVSPSVVARARDRSGSTSATALPPGR